MKEGSVLIMESNHILMNGMRMFLEDSTTIREIRAYKSFEGINRDFLKSVNVIIANVKEEVDFMFLKQIKKDYPEVRIILLSDRENLTHNYLFFQKHAADAFLLRNISPKNLIKELLQSLINSQTNLPATKKMTGDWRSFLSEDNCPLTLIQLCLLRLIGDGKAVKSISLETGLSLKEIEREQKTMLEKLSMNNITQAVLFAQQKGFIFIREEEKNKAFSASPECFKMFAS